MPTLLLDENERTVVNILNPGKSTKQLPERLPVDFIINNRICYPLYEKIGEELESEFDHRELEQIHKKAESMKFSIKELYKVSRIFKDNSIDFVLLFKAIESQCDSTDIDVVVKEDQIEKMRNILGSLGYLNTPWGGKGKVYAKTQKSGEAVQIDITQEGKIDVVNKSDLEILNNKKEVNGLYVPSSNDELNQLILKQVVTHRPITLGYMLHISNLLRHCTMDAQHYIKKSWLIPYFHSIHLINTIYKGLYSEIIESPLVEAANEIHQNSRILNFLTKIETNKATLPFKSTIFTSFCLGYKLFFDLAHFNFKAIVKGILGEPPYYFFPIVAPMRNLFRFQERKRIVVCFTGIDGTGKTSHATKIVERFKNMGIPCQYVWCNWVPRVSYPLMALIYLMTGGYRRKDYHKSKILRKIWNYVVIFDFIYLYFFKVKIPLLIGKNVVCDRYVYDMIADLTYDGLYNERASKILLRITPKTDLIFMLDVPEEVSDLRKNDTKDAVNIKESAKAIDYLRGHRNAYLKIANSLKIPVVDATKEFEELHNEIYKECLYTYVKRNKQGDL